MAAFGIAVDPDVWGRGGDPFEGLDAHPVVQRRLHRLVGSPAARAGVRRQLARHRKTVEFVRDELAREQLPDVLLGIPYVEGGYASRPGASSAGARGPWQLMPDTARGHGLVVGDDRDDRTDLRLATRAAVRHLRQLHDEQGDWLLAIAAYNAGSGAVSRVVERTGSRDALALAEAGELPIYVADVVAASIVVAHRDEL